MKHWRIWIILTLIVIVSAVGYFSSMTSQNTQTYEGTELSGDASDFKLIDQHGNLVSLSDFGGKVVVLTFFDSQCKDVCPLTPAQLLQTYKRLTPGETSQVVFIAVNVNVHANMNSDVLIATQKWHLDEIPSWHFLTGSEEELTPLWNAYGVASVPQEIGDIIHTPGVFLIDKDQQKRWYISTPYSEDGNAESTLPLSELLVNHIREILKDK